MRFGRRAVGVRGYGASMDQWVLRGARVVDLDRGGEARVRDVLVRDGRVAEVSERVTAAADEHDAEGRWLLPGLWDAHVHSAQWVLASQRLDLAGATSAADAVARVADCLRRGSGSAPAPLVGWGHRSATWSDRPTTAALDAVAGDRPVVLISGDGHHGWLSSAARRLLGLPPSDDVEREAPWFAAYARLQRLAPGDVSPAAYRRVLGEAAALGVTGIVDFEFGADDGEWRDRVVRGVDAQRVRVATYPEGLEALLATGRRHGDPLPGTDGLVTTGPLKVISDGSLNTRTAWCCEPYTDRDSVGAPNLGSAELRGLVARAAGAGLEVATHAIGDRAVDEALEAYAACGAAGSVEHAQLVRPGHPAAMARLGLRASVQPAHLLDDRAVSEACWADRTERCFALRSMLDAGVSLALGSDAPVSPLDPWLAVSAAVERRTGDGPWHPEQAITVREALAASVDGVRVRPGAPADLVLVDADPLGDWTATGRRPAVAATWCAGRRTV